LLGVKILLLEPVANFVNLDAPLSKPRCHVLCKNAFLPEHLSELSTGDMP